MSEIRRLQISYGGVMQVDSDVESIDMELKIDGGISLIAKQPAIEVVLECPTCPGAVTCSRCNTVRAEWQS